MVSDFLRTIRKVIFHMLGLVALLLLAWAAIFVVLVERPVDFAERIGDAKGIVTVLLLVFAVSSCAGWGIATQYHVSSKSQAAAILLGGLICGALIMALIAFGFMGNALINGEEIRPLGFGWWGAAVLYPFFSIGALLIIAWSFFWAPFYRSFIDFE